MDTHLISPPIDLGPAVAGRTRDEVGYMVVSAVGYVDARRSLRQLEQVQWTVEVMQARGQLADVPEPTLQQQAAAMAEIAGDIMAANTTGASATDYEVQVWGPKGNTKLRTVRAKCQMIAPLAGQGGPDEDLGMDAPPSAGASLADADALAATPGLAAVMAATHKLVKLCEEVPAMMLRHMATMEGQWGRVVKAREGEVDRLTSLVASQQTTINQLVELVDDAGSGGSPISAVPPEVVREGLEEVGSTLKAGLMHLIGAPHEAVGLLDAWKAMPAELRSALIDPATAAKLKDPNVQAFIAHTLRNMPTEATP